MSRRTIARATIDEGGGGSSTAGAVGPALGEGGRASRPIVRRVTVGRSGSAVVHDIVSRATVSASGARGSCPTTHPEGGGGRGAGVDAGGAMPAGVDVGGEVEAGGVTIAGTPSGRGVQRSPCRSVLDLRRWWRSPVGGCTAARPCGARRRGCRRRRSRPRPSGSRGRRSRRPVPRRGDTRRRLGGGSSGRSTPAIVECVSRRPRCRPFPAR